MYDCDYENSGNAGRVTVIMFIVMIISALSFILGMAAGIAVTKKVYRHRRSKLKKTVTTDYGDFDADEYVRSLNFD